MKPSAPSPSIPNINSNHDKSEATAEALRASEARFRTIFEESPIGIVLLDVEGKLVNANPASLQILGTGDLDNIVNFDFFSQGAVPSNHRAKLQSGETVRYETVLDFSSISYYRTKRAGIISIDVVIHPVKGEGRQFVTGYLIHLQEITERKRWEESLRLSETRFRQIYDNSAVMMHSINETGHLLNVNKKWLEELGYKRHEIIGRKIDLIMTPESSKRAFKEILPKFWMNGQVSNVPYQYVRKDGTLIDVLLDSAVMRDPVWGLVSLSVIRNVTEQRRAEKALLDSEQRFRAVFQGARDSIFIKNKAMQYTHVNPAMERLLGMSENNIIGKTAADIYGEQVGLHIQDVDSRVLSGESIEEEHSRTIHGEKLIFHDVRMPLRNAQDQIIGIFGISRNITERKRIEPTRSIPISEYPSPAMRATMEKAKFAAGTDGIVLLLGESGSGKDHLARWMHDNSKRASGPFFSINCAAVPHDLAESELFGHEAGAFTGARGRKRGLLELAEGGTLLLNEIGELSLPLQSKLLTFLDSRSFLRLGGEKSIRVNARLMAASHRDLQEEMLNGKFLEPLFYRLDVFTIRIPPLRERSQDMHILIRELTAQLAIEMQFAHIPEIDPETLEKLAGYHWPGNIRELRNVLERALMLSCDDRLVISMPSSKTMDDWHFTAGFPENKNLHDLSSQLIKELCLEALRRSRGEKKKAAALLGISRDSLYRFMKNFGIKSENRTHLSDNER